MNGDNKDIVLNKPFYGYKTANRVLDRSFKEFLPDNGTGGFMIEKNNRPIVAGFVYITNSKAVLFEWVVSDPEYREDDRDMAITCLISTVEKIVKDWGYKYMFTIGRTKKLIEKHKELGWHVDDKPSHEIVKILN